MDDFIYFLLVIGWLGYSFYKQSEKKKRQQTSMKTAQPDNAGPAYPAPVIAGDEEISKRTSEPDFKKTLEEILLGEPLSLEEIPQSEAQSLEVIPEAAVSDENRYRDHLNSEISLQSQGFELLKTPDIKDSFANRNAGEEPVLREEESGRFYFWEEFDLRRAVIYAEILNPKYVH